MLLLLTMLFLYATARFLQPLGDRLPTILIVILHVVPAAGVAVVHGAAVYGKRGMAMFVACCLGVGCLAELTSLHTGFPFGHYHFTGVMGPKVLDLPIFLALAYLGIGYASWWVAVMIVGTRRIAVTALVAAFAMTAWDLAMDPYWATLHRVWVWHDGGAFFGVPWSNFAGWFGIAFVYYLLFGVAVRGQRVDCDSGFLRTVPVILYAICALGNPLVVLNPIAPPVVVDAAGVSWETRRILAGCVAVSICFMSPLAGTAAWRATKAPNSPNPQRPQPNL